MSSATCTVCKSDNLETEVVEKHDGMSRMLGVLMLLLGSAGWVLVVFTLIAESPVKAEELERMFLMAKLINAFWIAVPSTFALVVSSVLGESIRMLTCQACGATHPKSKNKKFEE